MKQVIAWGVATCIGLAAAVAAAVVKAPVSALACWIAAAWIAVQWCKAIDTWSEAVETSCTVTTSAPHGLKTGDTVLIDGKGRKTVTVLDATTFSIMAD